MTKYRTIRRPDRNKPIPPSALRLLQELECLEFGFSLGGDMRHVRTLPAR